MSRRKGLSHEEKRQKMMELFYERKDFFQLKDLEKMGPKEKGVISQAVKDVVQSLVDDGMVDTEKIGTSVYFWAFPSKAINIRKCKIDDMNSKLQEMDKKLKISVSKVEQAKVGREEGEARTKALGSLKELEETQNKLNMEIQKYRDSDPEVLVQMKENIEVVQTVSAQTTVTIDCVFMMDYCYMRRSLARQEITTIEPTSAVPIAAPSATITGDTFVSSNIDDAAANPPVHILDSSIDETVHTTQDLPVGILIASSTYTPPAPVIPSYTLAIDSPQEPPRDGDLIIPASAVTLEMGGEHRIRRRCFEEGVEARLLTVITVTSTSITYTGTIVEEKPTLTIEYSCTAPSITPALHTCSTSSTTES